MNTKFNEEISKTQLKKIAKDIEDFGYKLTLLTEEQIQRLNLTDDIKEVIFEYKKIKSNSAKKRHRQYLGKLLRDIDLTFVNEDYQRIQNHSLIAKQAFHEIENWRDQLIQDESKLKDFIDIYPKTDIQKCRTLLKNAIKEAQKDQTKKAQRLFFKYLREVIET
jgi:ribosome-associated protein